MRGGCSKATVSDSSTDDQDQEEVLVSPGTPGRNSDAAREEGHFQKGTEPGSLRPSLSVFSTWSSSFHEYCFVAFVCFEFMLQNP